MTTQNHARFGTGFFLKSMVAVLCGALPAPSCRKADTELLPPPPVLTAAQERETFRFAEPGYRIELVAAEPMVQDPVALTFDGEGRLWVVEMRGYMRDIERNGVKDPIGRISVLEDTDGDGEMDRSTVFLDDLVLPRALSIQPDGILVAENEPLWFVEDRDGDLVGDRRTLVDPEYARDNIEHSANGLLRGMDNWIYSAKEGRRYRRKGDTWIREETESRGQWGICQDNRGRLFYNYNHSQLHADLVPPNAFSRNPNHDPTSGLRVGVTATNTVFPIRPTPAVNRGYIPGVLDGEGRIKEFTSACAPLIYRGDLFAEFAGNAFVCETAGNLVKRSVLTEQGVAVTGASAWPDRDFLASTDERFRPCWLTPGPDGAIYIADMYRGIVQDGPHMSPYLREHSIAREMDRPVHLGRIWRIVPETFDAPEPPDFGNMETAALVENLAHPSGWWRDMAQMHMAERRLTGAIPALREMALAHAKPFARLHALWTLEGLGDPAPEKLAPVLRDESPIVLAAALRVLPSLGFPDAAMLRELRVLSENSPAGEVALQILITLGDLEVDERARFELMTGILRPRVDDPLMRDALLSSLAAREADYLEYVWPQLGDENAVNPGQALLLEGLSHAIVQSRDAMSVRQLLSHLEDPAADWKAKALLSGLSAHGPALMRAPVALSHAPPAHRAHPQLERFFSWPGHRPPAPPKTALRPLTVSEEQLFARGRQVYLTFCVACHGADGEGMNLLAPPLAGSDWVTGAEERLVRVLFHGLTGSITVSGRRYAPPDVQPAMPPLAALSNADTAAVLTYIRRAWENAADPIDDAAVNRHRIEAQGRTVPWTEEELAPFAEAGPEARPGDSRE